MTTLLTRPIGLVVVHGDLDFASAPSLTSAVEALLDDHDYESVVVDLGDVHFVDLHGLRAIKQMERRGARIIPCVALVRLVRALGR